MGLATVFSCVTNGLHTPKVSVEVDIRRGGLPKFTVVGLAETAVKESKDRVRAALLNAQFEFPRAVITVNLGPADIPKEGGRFDLPIAIGILLASKQIKAHNLDDYLFVGELSLTGNLRAVSGLLPIVNNAAKNKKIIVIAHHNRPDASLVNGAKLICGKHLLEICEKLDDPISHCEVVSSPQRSDSGCDGSLDEIIGQSVAKRALQIAALGQHNVLMVGPPGSGKTLLAKQLPHLLPPLSDSEALEVASIAALSREGFKPERWGKRPFRAPHHTASAAAMVGGGSVPKPGEVSLAHQGILFLDELPEFKRGVLETLRQPLESGEIHIARAQHSLLFPAKFQLIATMNPCPCGFLGESMQACHCSSDQVARYRNRLSGPLLDRIDMHIHVARISSKDMFAVSERPAKASSIAIERINNGRQQMLNRQSISNAQLSPQEIETHAKLCKKSRSLVEKASAKLNVSMRGLHRLIRVSRSIADLEQKTDILPSHVAEAISLRFLDRKPQY